MKGLIFSLVLFLGLTHLAFADTVLSGHITSDTDLPSTNGTYIIEDQLIVDPGIHLTIEPGVIIKMGDQASILVYGTLLAIGNPDMKITLTSLEALPSEFDEWDITFYTGSENSKLEYVDLSYSYNPIILNSASLSFKNISVSNVVTAMSIYSSHLTLSESNLNSILLDGVDAYEGSKVELIDTKISGVNIGDAVGIYDSEMSATDVMINETNRAFGVFHSMLDVSSSTISNSEYQGIGVYDSSHVSIKNISVKNSGFGSALESYGDNNIEINNGYFGTGSGYGLGIYADFSTGKKPNLAIHYSTIENFDLSGISLYLTESAEIKNNKIKGNNIGIELDSSLPSLSSNSISGNHTYGLFNWSMQTVNAANNWWGKEDGPYDESLAGETGSGDAVNANIAYTPWLIADPLEVPQNKRIPVIIIPGIMGSYLNKEDGTEVWMNISKMLLPGGDTYLDDLLMQSQGESIKQINVSKLIFNSGKNDFYNGILDLLKSRGYEENVDIFLFPYDWRLDVNNISEKLKNRIDDVVKITGSSKVDVVAHSMGGYVIKNYLKKYPDNNIDKFIDIGTPHSGSPKILKIMFFGDDLNASILSGLLGLNTGEVKKISQNMPSVYELLPSPNYDKYVYDMDDLDNNGKHGLLDYQQTKEFLKNMGRNAFLVDKAEEFHKQIDNLHPADYGVRAYNIVGCGTETIGKYFILNKEDSGGVEYNIAYVNGDGTVPLKSAEAMPAEETYYLKNATHALMPSTSGVKELIVQILNATSSANIDISPYPNLASNSKGCSIPNGKIVSFHSPIDLHIYDANGHHAGPDANGDIENTIPGVDYEVIEGNKFAYLPDGLFYTVKGISTGNGSFNTRIQKVVNEEVVETQYFANIPLATSTRVIVATSTISMDQNGDGKFEKSISPTSILNTVQAGDVVKPVTDIELDHEKYGKDKKEKKSEKKVDVTLIASDDNSGVLKTEYKLNNKDWTVYKKEFEVKEKGENILQYRSIDRAGNIEMTKTAIITINKK